jgi:hypothetical protein
VPGVFSTGTGDFGAAGQHTQLSEHKPTHGESAKRVAVNFFGLTRSLTWTHESIKRNLIGPIESAGYKVRPAVCLYMLRSHGVA